MLGSQELLWLLRIRVFFLYIYYFYGISGSFGSWIESNNTPSSTYPVYCPFHSVLKHKLFSSLVEILQKKNSNIINNKEYFISFFDTNFTQTGGVHYLEFIFIIEII